MIQHWRGRHAPYLAVRHQKRRSHAYPTLFTNRRSNQVKYGPSNPQDPSLSRGSVPFIDNIDDIINDDDSSVYNGAQRLERVALMVSHIPPLSNGTHGKVEKIELCRYFPDVERCRHGSKCNFAHSIEEQENRILILRQRNYVEDILTDRNLPCMSHIMTGYCSFGDDSYCHTNGDDHLEPKCCGSSRCARLHDLRWAGNMAGHNGNKDVSSPTAWLKHREMPYDQFKMSDPCKAYIPVDSACHLMKDSMFEGGTLMRENSCYGYCATTLMGSDVTRPLRSYLLKAVCVSTDNHGLTRIKHQSFSGCSMALQSQMSELEVLTIALRMHHNPRNRKEVLFMYQPDHVLGDQPCMVLRQETFRIESGDEVRAYKIAFGPAGKDATLGAGLSIPPVAIWFNLDPNVLTKTTLQQARESHKKMKGGKLSLRASQALSNKLGIVENYHYDSDVTSLYMELMKLRLIKLRSEGQLKKHTRSSEDMRNVIVDKIYSVEVQMRVVYHRLFCTLKSFHERNSLTLCDDRSSCNISKMLELRRPHCNCKAQVYKCIVSNKNNDILGYHAPKKEVSRVISIFQKNLEDTKSEKDEDSSFVSIKYSSKNQDTAHKKEFHAKQAFTLSSLRNGVSLQGTEVECPTLHDASTVFYRAVWKPQSTRRAASNAAKNTDCCQAKKMEHLMCLDMDLNWSYWSGTILYPEFKYLHNQAKFGSSAGDNVASY